MRNILLLFFLTLIIPVFAQNEPVELRGVVYDLFTRRPVGAVSIINPKSGITIFSDSRGLFTTTAYPSDTLFLFAQGYRTSKFSVSDSVRKPSYDLIFGIEPLSTGLGQAVIVKAPKTLQEIEEARKKLGITPRELERPEISFTSPISALYELLSNRARERDKLKEQIKEIDRSKIFKELLNFYNENKLIDLPESYYDDFDRFCGYSIEYLKYSSDYEITERTVSQFNKYARWNGLIK